MSQEVKHHFIQMLFAYIFSSFAIGVLHPYSVYKYHSKSPSPLHHSKNHRFTACLAGIPLRFSGDAMMFSRSSFWKNMGWQVELWISCCQVSKWLILLMFQKSLQTKPSLIFRKPLWKMGFSQISTGFCRISEASMVSKLLEIGIFPPWEICLVVSKVGPPESFSCRITTLKVPQITTPKSPGF